MIADSLFVLIRDGYPSLGDLATGLQFPAIQRAALTFPSWQILLSQFIKANKAQPDHYGRAECVPTRI